MSSSYVMKKPFPVIAAIAGVTFFGLGATEICLGYASEFNHASGTRECVEAVNSGQQCQYEQFDDLAEAKSLRKDGGNLGIIGSLFLLNTIELKKKKSPAFKNR